uniref:Uncharacterized protein n=1 Tax=Zea mays TaxID=4577 RepID=C4J1N1_MAIZE|nr:unknown [Zea mays]
MDSSPVSFSLRPDNNFFEDQQHTLLPPHKPSHLHEASSTTLGSFSVGESTLNATPVKSPKTTEAQPVYHVKERN